MIIFQLQKKSSLLAITAIALRKPSNSVVIHFYRYYTHTDKRYRKYCKKKISCHCHAFHLFRTQS